MAKEHRNIIACIIGNILEWYEFSLFAYLAPVIATLFFPHQDAVTGLLLTLLIFAAGFVVRPLGSIFLGHLGDRWGRAKTLKVTILLMSIASALTGFLPTYEAVGIAAPILLMMCRLLQGFCIGGEFAGSIIYLSELSRGKYRAVISGMTNGGSNVGVLIAITACFLLSTVLSSHDLSVYGWRILFISGGLLGMVGLWLRRDLSESTTFDLLQKNIPEPYLPFQYVLKEQWSRMLHIMFLLFISAGGNYTLMAYLSTYFHQFLHVPLDRAYAMQTLFIIVSLFLLPCFSYLSDRIGRKKVLLFSIVGYLLFSIPSFMLLQYLPIGWVILPLIVFYSAEQAVMPALIVEMFPGKGRYTGISISYNMTMALIGGFSAAINTWLIHHFNNNVMPAYYIMGCAFVSLYIVLKYVPLDYGVKCNLSEA